MVYHAKLGKSAMFTVTLVTNPAMILEPALVRALRDAMGGGEAVWLDPNSAAEFPVSKMPRNLDEIRASLTAEGVDLVCQPSAGRRKKLLLADMDSTMIQQECIDELAAAAGIGAHVAAITCAREGGGGVKRRAGFRGGAARNAWRCSRALAETTIAEVSGHAHSP